MVMSHILPNISNSNQLAEIILNLKRFMQEMEISFPYEDIDFTGRKVRFSCRPNHRDPDEWYIASELAEGIYICTFGSWRTGKKYTWRSYDKQEFPEEKEFLLKIEQEHSIEAEERRALGLKEANKLWNSANPVLEHPYLERKNISGIDLKAIGNCLYIPFYDMDGNLATVQSIDPEGKKRFFKGLSTKGYYHLLGDPKKSDRIIFCEGYATGASIYLATNIPTVVCGSANNLPLVGRAFKQKYSDKLLILASDNDVAGVKTEEDWKSFVSPKISRCPVIKDYNDLHTQKGLEEVKKCFISVYKTFNIREFLELDIKPRENLNKILPMGSINVLYAEPGLGKSRFAYEMGFCISNDIKFLKFPTLKKARVLYIDGELTEWDIKERLQDMVKRYAISGEERLYDLDSFHILSSKDFNETPNLFNLDQQIKLNSLIQDNDLIILDNFNCLTIPDGADSYRTDAVNWKRCLTWLQSWKEKGKTFLMIMHTTKDGRLQGVKQIEAAVDLSYCLKDPTDKNKDKECLLHFEFHYVKCRMIPEYLKQPFEAQLRTDRQKYCGWKFEELDR